MEELKKYITEFSQEDQKKFENMYHAIPGFFGRINKKYLNPESGYDYWFLMNVIVPQKEKNLKAKIKDLARNKTINLFPEVVNMISERTVNKITSYRERNEDYKCRALNFAINSIYLESVFEREIYTDNSISDYLNYIIPIITTEEEDLIFFLNRFNTILAEELPKTYFDSYKSKFSIKDFISKIVKKYMK